MSSAALRVISVSERVERAALVPSSYQRLC
jgi:hypothetical protein